MINKRDLKTLLFSAPSLLELKKDTSWKIGVISLVISSIVMITPTDPKDFATFTFFNWGRNLASVFVSFVGVMIVLYIISRVFSKTSFVKFFSTVNTAFALSLLLVSLPAVIISNFVFTILLDSPLLKLMLFSLLPYYNWVIFGWACENTIETNSQIKRIIMAIISLSVIFFFFVSIKFITV